MDESHFQLLSLDAAPLLSATAPLTIGIDRKGDAPKNRAPNFDILLTTAKKPSREWVSVSDPDEVLALLRARIAAAPLASHMLAQLLRLGEVLSFEQALVAESFAYSILLGGSEFHRWRDGNPSTASAANDLPRLTLAREGNKLVVTLARPERRNAVDARLRDELVEALQLPLLDDSIQNVELRGEGPCFSSGGDLAEFGTAKDVALAHHIRTTQSPVRDIYRLQSRVTAFMQGASIGSGVEIPAAAMQIIAKPDASFRLPEISMGLIPGAGGTVSISRRIGRHRTCFFALTNEAIDAATAFDWGLVDGIEAAK